MYVPRRFYVCTVSSYIEMVHTHRFFVHRNSRYVPFLHKSHEQRLITKDHIATHTHLHFALYSSTVVIKLSKCNTLAINVVVSYFKPKLLLQHCKPLNALLLLDTPSLKLKHSILLVMYNWLNAFYCETNGKYSITLLFFGRNSQCALLLYHTYQ